MGTPEDDARLLAALNQKGQGGTPDPAADAAAKAAAVAAAKALVTAFKAKLPANVTLSGHSGVDPTADPSSVTVSVVVPPKAAVPVAVATPVAPVGPAGPVAPVGPVEPTPPLPRSAATLA